LYYRVSRNKAVGIVMLTMDEFIRTCREKGLNVTYQRMVIYKSLMHSKNHPTAEEIYHMVRKEYPSISLATVYKTLETFAELKIINKVTHLHDMARYDADTRPHHHMICVYCKAVQDVHDERLNRLPMPDMNYNGFQITGYSIQFEGVCVACAQKFQRKASSN